jgi:hypothetical protein
VIHSLTANIWQFVSWRVRDEFIINVQDDDSDDEISSESSFSSESDSELAQPL